MPLSKKQEELCSESEWDFSNLSALFLNCTLKPKPKESPSNKPAAQIKPILFQLFLIHSCIPDLAFIGTKTN